MQLRLLLAGLPGLFQSLLVAAETVVQDSRYQLAELDPHVLPGRSRVLRHDLDQPGGISLRPPETGENYGRERRKPGPCRLCDRICLRDQRSSRRKIATPNRI